MSKLKQLRLAHDIQRKRRELAAEEDTAKALQKRRADLEQRSEVAEGAIEEVNDETPAEDIEAVEQQTDALIAEDEQLTAEEKENEKQRSALQEEIQRLESELEEINTRAREAAKPQTGAAGVSVIERKEVYPMETRKILGMTYEQRHALFTQNDAVKGWLETLRSCVRNGFVQRGVENGELTIPDVMLGIIRENAASYSKLLPHVQVRDVPGTGRMLIDGSAPEAVWTDMCGKLNELSFGLAMTNVDGHKLGGFIGICNALLQDGSDPVQLGTEIMTKLTQADAIGIDKAILYGKGNNMPLGIATRLAQTVAPDGYSPKDRPWVNLKSTNVLTETLLSGTPEALFSGLMTMGAAAKRKYATGKKFWAMSEGTKTKLLAASLALNSAGAVVAGFSDSMPVTGEPIVTLDFIPDNDFFTGYGENYLWARRAGQSIRSSEHTRLIEDQTVFVTTSRHDGKPVIAEAFVHGNIAGTAPTASIDFAEDEANASA